MRNRLAALMGGVALAGCVSVATESKPDTAALPAHWAFQPVHAPAVPAVETAAGQPGNPVDAFLLARLQQAGLSYSPEADRRTLARRARLILTGLPPTPAEVEEFVADGSPDAFARMVDRLLESPAHGEHWARHWLDLARYAESEGFKADETRPNAWRYRDYVIKSLNADKPYDRFVQEQLAGDELWPGDGEAVVATAFNRHFPDESNARNLMQRRQEILNDVTDTVGLVFTGLTVGCARCHDHKYDPISQADYYRLQAFFANTAADDSIPLLPAGELAAHNARLAEWREATASIRKRMEELEAPAREAIILDYVEKYPEEVRVALAKAEGERTPFEAQMVAKAKLYVSPESHQYIAQTGAVVARMKKAEREEWEGLNKELAKHAGMHPGELPIATGMVDLGEASPRTFLLRGGAWDSPKEEVRPGFPAVFRMPDPSPRSEGRGTSGRRAALAEWLTSKSNPLTARVIVNRVWQQHFGRGLVGTASDFGVKGEEPTHPELLDWLANWFMEEGWSLKKLHRLLTTSEAWRQSSEFNAAAQSADPENRLLWRFNRRRLPGEAIRDASLSISGLLNPAMGGQSVFPELPDGMVRYGWSATEDQASRNRRSIYVFVRRNIRYPLFEAFDMPDTHESCARRNATTSPVQALMLMNNRVVLDWASALAGRVLNSSGQKGGDVVATAFNLAYGRSPDAGELELAKTFLERQAELIHHRHEKGEEVAAPAGMPKDSPALAEGAALVDLCHTLLNANEFIYIN